MPDAVASRARAEALANKLLGESGAHMATDAIVANAKTGTRDADGNVISVDDAPFGGAKPRPVAKAKRPEPVEDDDENLVEEFEHDEVEDDDEEDVDDEAPDTEEEEGGDEEDTDESDEDEYEEIPYDDDDEFDVTVDGETRSVSLRELKNRYSLSGATEKRLQEATEARKAAAAERQEFLNEAETYRTNLVQTLQQLDSVLFQPLVEPPDPAMRSSNINRYLQLKDYYDEDQKRINAARQTMTQFFDQQKAANEQAQQAYRAQQTQLLVEKLPELRDPKKGPKVQQEIMDAAAYYGFTPKQVQQVNDHALFLMARDAARWLNLQKMKQNGGGKVSTPEGAKRRKMRSGGPVAQKAQAVKNAKQQRALETQARATGREGDVANFLASKATKVRRNKIGRSS